MSIDVTDFLNPQEPTAQAPQIHDNEGGGLDITDFLPPQELTSQVTQPIKEFFQDPLQNNTISQILNLERKDVGPNIEPNLTPMQQLVGGALHHLYPPLALEDRSRQLLGTDSALGTGINQASQLGLGFNDEARGALDTLRDMLTNNLPQENPDQGYIDRIVNQYRYNRDIARENLSREQQRHPSAAALGQMAGGFALTPFFLKGSPMAQTLKGGGVGGAMGLGYSEADLTQGEFGQAAKDTATNAAVLASLAGVQSGLQKFSNLFKAQNLDDLAAHARISGGGDPSKAAKFDNIPEGQMPASVRGMREAEKAGLLKRRGNFISNVEPQSSSDKLLTKAGQEHLLPSEFNPAGRIDYDRLRIGLGQVLTEGRQDKLALLNKHLKNDKIPLPDLLGENPSATGLRTMQAVRELDARVRQYKIPMGDEEIQALQYLKKNFTKMQTTPQQAEELSRNLGILTRKYAGKQYAEGSPQQLLRDTKTRIDQNLANRLEQTQKGLGKTYTDMNHRLFDLSEFLETVKEGQIKYFDAYGKGDQFKTGVIPRTLNSVLPKGGSLSEMIRNMVSTGGNVAGGLINASSYLLKPPVSTWMSRIFSSYVGDKGIITAGRDKALGRHFILTNPNISEEEKTEALERLGYEGYINPKHIPKNVQGKAQDIIIGE